MTSVKLMLNRHRVLNSGKYPLVFQVIHNRKKRLIYTGITLFPEEFDGSSLEIMTSKSGSYSQTERRKMNQELKRKYKGILSNIRELEKNKDFFSVDDLFDVKKKVDLYLIQFAGLLIARKRKNGKEGIAVAYQSTSTNKKGQEVFVGKELYSKPTVGVTRVELESPLLGGSNGGGIGGSSSNQDGWGTPKGRSSESDSEDMTGNGGITMKE